MDTVLLSLFEHTKLNDKQRRVYLAAMQLGNATVSQIAEAAQIKRTNTYTIITELVEMGYLHQVIGKKKTYAAADPNTFASELRQNSRSFEEMLPYLHAIQRRNGKPYVQYYSGVNGVKEAFSQIYKPKDARYFTSIERNLITIPDEVTRWQKLYRSGKAAPESRHIFTNTESDRAFAKLLSNNKQRVKFLPPELGLNVDIVLADDKVFLTSFEEEIHVTVIKSKAIFDALGAIYDLAWDKLSN